MSPLERNTGAWTAGHIGRAVHSGDPLSVEEIKALQPETRIVVTWAGGNGPHEGTVVNDEYLGLCYESARGARHPLLKWPEQRRPLNRVTLAGRKMLDG